MDHPPSPSAGTIALQLTFVLALVLANGFFVASEFALVSVRRTRIDQLAAGGSSAAVVVQRAVRDLDRYIAATQVGITLASLLLGGIGERALEPLLHPLFEHIPKPWLPVASTSLATGLAYFIMTALHVIIGELMPKSIALQKAEMTALVIGRPMTFCAKVFTPLIWMLNGTGNFLLRRIGFHPAEGHEQVHSPQELDLIFAQSHEGGELNKTEFEILHRVVRFSDTTAREVMVPRVEMQAIPLEMTRRALLEYLHHQPHTRVPVYHGSMDEVVGIAHLKDLVRFEASLPHDFAHDSPADGSPDKSAGSHNGAFYADEVINLMEQQLVREAARVPETITIDRLLIEFKRLRQQMAIVIDEYGGTSGIVTMGDLLEQVFGDVHDEFDQPEPEMVPRADGRIQMAGRVLIDEVNERYGLGFRADEADTMAGLVLSALGRPAAVGDEVKINGAHIRVEGIDRLRIMLLSMELPADASAKSGDQTG